eukprot:10583329-Ditylum_brightwellii.AAC.1
MEGFKPNTYSGKPNLCTPHYNNNPRVLCLQTNLSRKESMLLYSITKAAIKNKIVNPIVEANAKLHKGTDGLLLWEKLDQIHKEQEHDYATLLRMLKMIQEMSKNPRVAPLSYLNRFTAAVNKLRYTVTIGGAIQLPPNNMLAYYFIDGLCFPKEDFLPILSDLKKNNGNAKEYLNPTGDLTYTMCKALEHAQLCKEIKGMLPTK